MFQSVEMAKPDAILGITEAFKADTNPNKINLSVGVYKSEAGVTPILASVREAEKRILATETSKGYLPIPGDAVYGKLTQEQLFGEGHEVIESGRVMTANTPGGTGALRVAADTMKRCFPKSTVWFSNPTWANHMKIFASAGVPMKTYTYFDPELHGLNFERLLESLQHIPSGDFVVLHGCCHNPTGADPMVEQWKIIAELLATNGVIPIVDFAYQGFAKGSEADRAGLLEIAKACQELVVCSSYSKNFGLYKERVGAVSFVGKDAETAQKIFSQVKICIRTNYSNPPAHGSAIVSTILGDAELKAQWTAELTEMRERISGMRKLFVDTLSGLKPDADFGFIQDQIGMFSYSGLTSEQVASLKADHGIYVVGDGRINVAGMTKNNMSALCKGIAAVL